MKLWGGRFSEDTDTLVEKLNASIDFDKKLYQYDILGSKKHAEMLGHTGIIKKEEADKIVKGLTEVEKDIEKGKIKFDYSLEDIHTVVEKNLIDKIGQVGGKLHTARSRNDQVALDMRLYLRDVIENICSSIENDFLPVLLKLADKYKEYIMPGYTHLQRAQPVTFGHYLLAYYFKLKRDYERFQDNLKRVNVLPLGSGALAGTSFPVDREYIARELNFDRVGENSIDGVSDRDFIIEFLSIASTLIMHLSRFSEEIILWATSEFAFIQLDDKYATGSSIMPQKKNPDVAELVRGKTGRIYGHLMQLLTTLKGLPLAYNKDLQEDKEGLFDTVDTLNIILKIYPEMLATMEVNKAEMEKATRGGFINATELANYLVQKGLPFRKAHEVVGKAVRYAIKKDIELNDIEYEKWQELFADYTDIIDPNIKESLDIENIVNNTKSTGGPAPEETERIINKERSWLNSRRNR
ncbi:MAG: argininosuccinate lyase [Bacillota bacterium]